MHSGRFSFCFFVGELLFFNDALLVPIVIGTPFIIINSIALFL